MGSTAKVSKSGSKSQDDKKSQKKRQSINYKPSTSKRGGDDKKKIRFHPGTVALREIYALQKRTHLLIQKRPFQLLVRDLMSKFKGDLRWRASVQEAAEHHIVSIFEHAVLLSVHRQKKTVIARDLDVVMRIHERLEGALRVGRLREGTALAADLPSGATMVAA